MLQDILKNLGLSEKEIRIYLAILEFGTQPASVIAKKIKIPRSTVRFVMDQLTEKTFLSKSLKGNTQYYTPIPPKQVIETLKIKRQEQDLLFQKNIKKFEHLTPQIESMLSTKVSLPKVKLFDGIEGIKKLYQEVLDVGEDIDSIEETGELYHKFIPDFADYFIRERVRRKIFNRCISPNVKDEKKLWNRNTPKEWRHTKFLPANKFLFNCDVKIFGDNISIVTFDEKSPMGIIIKHPKIANHFKLMFKLMWEVSETLQKFN